MCGSERKRVKDAHARVFGLPHVPVRRLLRPKLWELRDQDVGNRLLRDGAARRERLPHLPPRVRPYLDRSVLKYICNACKEGLESHRPKRAYAPRIFDYDRGGFVALNQAMQRPRTCELIPSGTIPNTPVNELKWSVLEYNKAESPGDGIDGKHAIS